MIILSAKHKRDLGTYGVVGREPRQRVIALRSKSPGVHVGGEEAHSGNHLGFKHVAQSEMSSEAHTHCAYIAVAVVARDKKINECARIRVKRFNWLGLLVGVAPIRSLHIVRQRRPRRLKLVVALTNHDHESLQQLQMIVIVRIDALGLSDGQASSKRKQSNLLHQICGANPSGMTNGILPYWPFQ